MRRSSKRLIWLLASVPALVVCVALLYLTGMATLEGKQRGFWDSVEWAAETLTTTGYGADNQHAASAGGIARKSSRRFKRPGPLSDLS